MDALNPQSGLKPEADPAQDLDRRARRNLLLLACCQAVGQSCNTMMFAATGLSVITFYHHPEFANLPVTMQHLGVMIWVFPAALLMQRVGRSIGFRVGSLFGMAGAIIMCTGLYTANFAVMCAGGLILGYAVACLQMYRFAAAELVPIHYRAKAISWVTAGGVAAAVIGPSLVRVTHDLVMPLYLATYAAILGLHVIVFAVMSFITFPSVAASAAAEGTAVSSAPPRPLWVIASQPRFIASVIAGMLAFGTMSFIMSASPLAIVGCGFPHAEAHWVIFMHVLGMFVPSFFTGNLINRYGATTVMAWGVMLMLAGVAAALAGLSEWNFRIALTVNGVGWNFLFVGATTVVTTCYRPSERGKTQALNDLLVFSTTATSSFMAGFLQDRWGWHPLNWFSVLLMLAAAAAVIWLRYQRPTLSPAH
ncbi:MULTISPECIES: MFS transporter [unclassified Bradyrhizobium]|uniref:MFS transporter n=1 Tax=unclassified Bradyrhizobium TaxID=2631580 RepID=UPI001BA4D710|nr:MULTISPECIES: MFS transporter [unclassified Bradyrhizobium]MBR1228174.1 MFS transporter [Bradyrhizobium sp. AUGA SZCCT0176]MBR1302004.1 MFS transporter [Bradyrhizobium sp. AUGA SZCCT0042]